MLEDVLGNELDSEHGLFAGWLYAGFWKKKPEPALISELKGEGMFNAKVVSPI